MMLLGFIVLVMVYAGLQSLSDFDRLIGPKPSIGPAIAFSVDMLVLLYGLALLIWRPWQ